MNDRMTDAAEMLWVVLANVSGGDWTKQSTEWQEAAARWRDNYFAALKADRLAADAGTAARVQEERLLALAQRGAYDLHCQNRNSDRGIHTGQHDGWGAFQTCPHPDCVLVRSPAPVSK